VWHSLSRTRTRETHTTHTHTRERHTERERHTRETRERETQERDTHNRHTRERDTHTRETHERERDMRERHTRDTHTRETHTRERERDTHSLCLTLSLTRWQRCIGGLEWQVSFRKRATNYWAVLREMTYQDKASYGSSPPCTSLLISIRKRTAYMIWLFCGKRLVKIRHPSSRWQRHISCPRRWVIFIGLFYRYGRALLWKGQGSFRQGPLCVFATLIS